MSKLSLFLVFFLAIPNTLTFADPISVPDLRIGVSTSLTGEAAPWGEDIRNALLFANDELAGGRYRLLFEDDACSAKAAASIAHRFVQIEKLHYVLGHACSGAVIGAAPIYEAAKVVVISPSASAPSVTKAGEYIFRTWPSDAIAATKLFRYMAARHKQIGMISEESEYAQSFVEAFSSLNSPPVTSLVNHNYLSATTDYRPTLLRLKSKGIDGLFLNTGTDATMLRVIKQVREVNLAVPLYCAYFAGAKAFLDQAGALAEGIVFVDTPNAEDFLLPESADLMKRYRAKYGSPNFSEMLTVTTFEAFRALHLAIESGRDVRAELAKGRYQGLAGEWSFDPNGDPVGIPFVLKIVRNGRPVVLEK